MVIINNSIFYVVGKKTHHSTQQIDKDKCQHSDVKLNRGAKIKNWVQVMGQVDTYWK